MVQEKQGVVEFEDAKALRNKHVRGLLQKRAKRYTEEESEGSDDGNNTRFRKKVQKHSMADAFKSIMNKTIMEDGDDPVTARPETVLTKYKKKERDLNATLAEEEAETKKRHLKEQMRLMGRAIPNKHDDERERSLQIIATKGVVQLFNAVAEYQTSAQKDSIHEQKVKTENRTAHI